MYNTIEKIQTLDGMLFDTVEEAEAYVVDKVTEEINEWFKGQEFRAWYHSDVVKILKCLAGDTKALKRLHSLINKYVDNKSDNDENTISN